jgi:hypothetical protein
MRKHIAKAAVAVTTLATSVVVFADPPAYMTDLTSKLGEAQTVMAFFIGVAVVWAGYRMVRRVIK